MSDLCSGLAKYHRWLIQQQERTKADQSRPEHVRSLQDAWEMNVVEGDGVEVKDHSDYAELQKTLSQKAFYEAICLEPFGPRERYQRRHWCDKLVLPYPVTVWSHAYGNNLGNKKEL